MAKRLKLKQLRVGLDLSQEEMAKALDIERSQYSKIELGKQCGALEVWDRLQTRFNVPKDEAFEMMTEMIN
jgi:DNA-binding XRE family transcriptional regulator